jgi:hypothetical protein
MGAAQKGQREAYLVQVPSMLQAFAFASTWAVESGDPGLRPHALQIGRRALVWSGVDEHSFDLEVVDGRFLDTPFEGVYMSTAPTFEVGHVFPGQGFEVKVLAADCGYPTRLRFRFDARLDAPSARYLVPGPGGALRHHTPPAAGEVIDLPMPERLRPLLP